MLFLQEKINEFDYTRQLCGATVTGMAELQRAGGFTVWIAHSSAGLAFDIAERLRGLDADVRFWDDAGAFMSAPSTRALPDEPVGPPVIPAWRGGLAPGALRRVRAHIEQAFAKRIDVRELAAMAGLSECHFSRAFRHSVGVPPHRYVMTRRIAIAAGLIRQTDRSLSDIALAVGFSDQSHFTRAFIRMNGEAPSAFRRRHQ